VCPGEKGAVFGGLWRRFVRSFHRPPPTLRRRFILACFAKIPFSQQFHISLHRTSSSLCKDLRPTPLRPSERSRGFAVFPSHLYRPSVDQQSYGSAYLWPRRKERGCNFGTPLSPLPPLSWLKMAFLLFPHLAGPRSLLFFPSFPSFPSFPFYSLALHSINHGSP
jgi:hypothetical protein